MNFCFFFKDVKGPKKLFPDLPFGNMDSDRVEARKNLLESFLKVSILLLGLCFHSTHRLPSQGIEIRGLEFLFEVFLVSFAATLCHS